MPPVFYANYRTKNFWSGAFWNFTKNDVIKRLEHRVIKEIYPWLELFEDIEKVQSYIYEIEKLGSSHALQPQNLKKWGLVSGAADLKTLIVS